MKAEGNGAAKETPLTSDDLSDGQLGWSLALHAFMVRCSVLKNLHLRKVVLAMALHRAVRSDSIALRPDANPSTLHADQNEQFVSPAKQELDQSLATLDPLAGQGFADEVEAFDAFLKLGEEQLDELIGLLTVELLTHGSTRPGKLMLRLAEKIGVRPRDHWMPDAAWLTRYRKVQLLELFAKLSIGIRMPGPDTKHSELVSKLAHLFETAANGTETDSNLAKIVNTWCPKPLVFDESSSRQ